MGIIEYLQYQVIRNPMFFVFLCPQPQALPVFTYQMPQNFGYFSNQQTKLPEIEIKSEENAEALTRLPPIKSEQVARQKRLRKPAKAPTPGKPQNKKSPPNRQPTPSPPQSKYPFQNKQRNILPNIVHQIFCFVTRQGRSRKIVQRYLSNPATPEHLKFDVGRYYKYQVFIKDKVNLYLNLKNLRELNVFQQPDCQNYKHNQQIAFIHMNRVLIRYFLANEFQRVVLTSYRMKPETRIWNLKMKRKILEEFKQIFH